MFKRCQLCLFATTGAGLAIYGVLAASYPPPLLVCDDPNHDFETVATSAGVVSHTFVLRNAGGRPLHITNIQSTCRCTGMELSRSVIQPGEDAKLRVRMTVPESATRTEAHIQVQSNDPQNPTFEFSVSADPRPFLILSPSSIHLGDQVYQEIEATRFMLSILTREPDGLTLQVEDWFEPSTVHAEIGGTSKHPNLTVWLDPKAPIGPITATIVIGVQSGIVEPVKASVRGEVIGPVVAEPGIVHLGLVRRGLPNSARVLLGPLGALSEFEAQVAEVTDTLAPYLIAELSDEPEGKHLMIRVRDSVFEHAGAEFKGAIRVFYNGLQSGVLQIPVSFFVDSK